MSSTTDPAVFRTTLYGHAAELDRKATAIVNGVTFQLYAWIAEGTRVDTGRMRAGWMIGVYAAGPEKPPEGQSSYSASPLEFVAELEAAPLTAKRVIYNNVEYVVWWEYGTDRHGGDHMVKLAIQRLISGG